METSHTGLISPTTSTPSKACVSCAQAKVKCTRDLEPGSKCSRCQRLSKVCEPAVRRVRSRFEGRKPPSSTNRVSSSHVKKLEEKLEGIVSLLKSTHDIESSDELSTINSHRPVNLLDQAARASPLPLNNTNRPNDSQSILQNAWHTKSAPTSARKVPDPYARTFDGPEWGLLKPLPTAREANALLETFQNETSLYFPFIAVPRTTSADELRKEKPFLYLAIMAVTSTNHPQQVELSKVIVRQMAQRVFVDGERSIDLLLGILTLAGWYRHSIPHITGIAAAANVLVFDLGLLRIPNEESHSLLEEAMHASVQHLGTIKSVKTLEEKRALLGTFLLGSSMSISFRRTEGIRYSPYLEECRRSLGEGADHPNDRSAAAIVKLQAILERIQQYPWNMKSDAPSISLPAVLLVNSVEEQLKGFRNEYSYEMKNNWAVSIHYYSTQIALYQIGLSRPSGSVPTVDRQDFKQVELLYACLQATKSVLELYISVPARNFYFITIVAWIDLRQALIALQKLSVFRDPDWSLAYVRDTLDFLWVLDQFIEKIKQAAAELNFDENHVLSLAGQKIAMARNYCAERMVGRPSDNHLSGARPGTSEYHDANFIDDMWFEDLFDLFEYQYDTGTPNM